MSIRRNEGEMQPLKIVLASESKFRRRAMDMVGVRYETRPASIDEKAIRHDDPEQLTRQLAEAKAWKVAGECPDAVIVRRSGGGKRRPDL
jgi:predicted house-cleaning NTP pyrophosphatase (Maf/HAM1 superfamily)